MFESPVMQEVSRVGYLSIVANKYMTFIGGEKEMRVVK